MRPSAPVTAASTSRSSPVGKPVSIALVISWARSRSSNVATSASTPCSASAATVASASRSPSIRVEDGWPSPAEMTAMVRVLMGVPSWLSEAERGTARGGLGGGVLGTTAGPLVLAGDVRGTDLAGLAGGSDTAGVRGRVGRHVGRTLGLVLLAQRRHDLLGQDVDLLEDGLERQPGVVDEEQLALVVPDVLAHGGVAVDDLLRGAHGQWGLPGEVLHRGTVAVDRGVVEVGAELVPGVLGVLPGEELPAQPDDRLVGLAVPVVLVALAVVGDHPLGVLHGPEDVVVQEAVTVVGGLLSNLRGADRPVPHEGRHAVQRSRGGGEALQRRAELALPVHHLLLPETAQQRVVLDRQVHNLTEVHAEPGLARAGVAATHHE